MEKVKQSDDDLTEILETNSELISIEKYESEIKSMKKGNITLAQLIRDNSLTEKELSILKELDLIGDDFPDMSKFAKSYLKLYEIHPKKNTSYDLWEGMAMGTLIGGVTSVPTATLTEDPLLSFALLLGSVVTGAAIGWYKSKQEELAYTKDDLRIVGKGLTEINDRLSEYETAYSNLNSSLDLSGTQIERSKLYEMDMKYQFSVVDQLKTIKTKCESIVQGFNNTKFSITPRDQQVIDSYSN